MQQLPYIEKTGSKKEISSLKWTTYNGGIKVFVNFQIQTGTDTDNLNIVVYQNGNSLSQK